MAASIFTKIINREIPASIVYEDDRVIGFLDIDPVQKGHTLIVPKKAFENALDGDEEELAYMIKIAKKITPVIMEAVGADGANFIMNNGAAAGQEVFHAHLHIVPRHEGDESFVTKKCGCYAEQEAAALATQISAALAEG